MTGRSAACEIPAKRNGHRAFVGIYPPGHGIENWRIKRFEIPAELVDQSIYDGSLLDLQFIKLESLEDVEDTIRSWGISPSMFDAPWKCDWPF